MFRNKLIMKIMDAVGVLCRSVNSEVFSVKTFVFFGLTIFMSAIFLFNVVAQSRNSIVAGDKWRFFKGVKDAPENWQDINFDDSGWFEGRSGIGYGNNPKNGEIVTNKDGTFTYIPDKGFTGTDTFTYKVEDDKGAISEAKVTVTVSSASTFPLNVRQANIGSVPLKDDIISSKKETSDSVNQGEKDEKKLEFDGIEHEFKDDIDNINKRPEVNDDFVFADKNGEIKIDVLENDDDGDGVIDPQTILLGNSKDGELDDMQGEFLGILGRKEFVITDPEKLKDLSLGLVCDGQAIVFINRIEVFRTEIPVNEKIDIVGFTHELFPGLNILSIKCSNDDIDSDDFSFIPSLEITEKGGR